MKALTRRIFALVSALGGIVIVGSFYPILRGLFPYPNGVYGYVDTPLVVGTSYRKHDPYRPLPPVVDPGPELNRTETPPDAIVLFDGSETDAWTGNKWPMKDGVMIASRGDMISRQPFGDCRVYMEWRAPYPPRGMPWDRGNSGIIFMERYELQIADSWESSIYADGSAGSLYGQTPPRVNASRRPGEWQTFDASFTAPRFDASGTLLHPARITVVHNGVLVQDHEPFHGPTSWRRHKSYEAHQGELPLRLQYHNNPVEFRKIWVKSLQPQTSSISE